MHDIDLLSQCLARVPGIDSTAKVEPRRNAPRGSWNGDYADVMTGADCDFWPRNGWKRASDSPKWDAEQEIPIVLAVKLACSLIGASDAHRWAMIVRALDEQARKYADDRRESR
jgi:hypothetical protein